MLGKRIGNPRPQHFTGIKKVETGPMMDDVLPSKFIMGLQKFGSKKTVPLTVAPQTQIGLKSNISPKIPLQIGTSFLGKNLAGNFHALPEDLGLSGKKVSTSKQAETIDPVDHVASNDPSPIKAIKSLPFVIKTPGQYYLKKGLTFIGDKQKEVRDAISFETGDVQLNLNGNMICLDYCYGGGGGAFSPYTPENTNLKVRVNAINTNGFNNITISNGTICGIDKADTLDSRTDWTGVRVTNSRDIVVEKVHFHDLRNGVKCTLGTATDGLSVNECVTVRKCKFVDILARFTSGVSDPTDVIINYSSNGDKQVGGVRGYWLNGTTSTPNWQLTPQSAKLVATEPIDASTALTNASAISGNFAFCQESSTTSSYDQIINCQNAGAAGVIIYATSSSFSYFLGDSVGSNPLPKIPSASVTQSSGTALSAVLGSNVSVFSWDNPFTFFDAEAYGGSFSASNITGLKFNNNQVLNSSAEYALYPYSGGTLSITGYDVGPIQSHSTANNICVKNNIMSRIRHPILFFPIGDVTGGIRIENNNILLRTGDNGENSPLSIGCVTSTCFTRATIIKNNTVKFEDDLNDMSSTIFMQYTSSYSGIVEGNTFCMPTSGMGVNIYIGLYAGYASVSDDIIVRNNTLQGPVTSGHICCRDGKGYKIVENNISGGNYGVRISPGAGANDPSSPSVTSIAIENNFIHDCAVGVYLRSGTGNTFIDHNKFSGHTTAAVQIDTGVSNTLLCSNMFMGNTVDLIDAGTNTVVPAPNAAGANINGPTTPSP